MSGQSKKEKNSPHSNGPSLTRPLSGNMKKVLSIIKKYDFKDYAWIDPKKIVVSDWVRLKCMFGCEDYGNAACPPNVPAVVDCRNFFKGYKNAIVFHFEKSFDDPADQRKWAKQINSKLLKAEREVFLAGYYKAFLFLMSRCKLCQECVKDRLQCKNPRLRRPTPEALAVDVFATVRQYGFPIEVVKDYSERINRYAFLMID